jgi:hypothetical protein
VAKKKHVKIGPVKLRKPWVTQKQVDKAAAEELAKGLKRTARDQKQPPKKS